MTLKYLRKYQNSLTIALKYTKCVCAYSMCLIGHISSLEEVLVRKQKEAECGCIYLWSHHWGGLSLWVLGLPVLHSETSSPLAKKYKKRGWLWTILEEKTEIYREVPCEYPSFSWNGTGAYLANSNCHYRVLCFPFHQAFYLFVIFSHCSFVLLTIEMLFYIVVLFNIGQVVAPLKACTAESRTELAES